ncbi:MAG: peptide deformylase [Opitutales bacterium]|nr:peptide deformylase [Opitutales bacterium]
MELPVVHYGNPVLRKKGEPVTVFDAALKQLADDMVETMHATNGIGLAAPQVGLSMQFFVIDLRPAAGEEQDFELVLDGKAVPAQLAMPMAFANATIELLDEDEWSCREGCLSFPGIRGEVVRCENVRVRFQDVEGNPHVLECTGMLARCAQHENDHCQGIVFVDRMEARDRLRNTSKLKLLKRDTLAELKASRRAGK